ncbi:hypothetical protein DL96DRAFT_1607771 [Flagelloscypha sp. PMI_526]|nr:hypothetical protein DL96DRAFT_1607771 [Flagelloscypha sp. PMI_526]
MTALLFLELHQEVLQLLTKKDLKTLSLVNSDFQRLAQSLLFRKIQFNLAKPDSWDFLNSERGRELCSGTQYLHMFRATHDWSGPHNYTTDGLTDFMRAFASLRTLSCSMIRPELETLSLYAMEVPLWDILAQSPLLKLLKLRFVVTSEPSTPASRVILPEITELDLGDLSSMTGSTDRLWRLISSMSSLHTLKVDTDHNSHIISLDFMPLSKPNLRTISFGVQFYDWVGRCFHFLVMELESHYLDSSEKTILLSLSIDSPTALDSRPTRLEWPPLAGAIIFHHSVPTK